jgi:hypothetical protein
MPKLLFGNVGKKMWRVELWGAKENELKELASGNKSRPYI